MSTSPFDRAISLSGEPNELRNDISDDYQNMVGPFGGITAATLLNAVCTHPEAQGSPVSITVNYLGPIQASQIGIKPRLVRQNRSNQHWIVEAETDNELVLTSTVVLAHRAQSWASTEMAMPEVPHHSEIERLSPQGLTTWVSQYDMRFVQGNPMAPVDPDCPPSESINWVSDSPPRKLDFQSLCAICDSLFPRILIHRRERAPFGTVSLTVYFHATQQEMEALASPWVLTHARASRFQGRFCDQTAEAWSEDGTLLATTSQLGYFKHG